jgi:hypothetical protein
MADGSELCGRGQLDHTRLKYVLTPHGMAALTQPARLDMGDSPKVYNHLHENEALATELNTEQSIVYIEEANELQELNLD